MSKKKKFINAVFLIICFLLTMYYVFHGQNLKQIFGYIKEANWGYWIAAVFCVIGFIMGESIIILYLMRTLKQKVKVVHCLLYSFIGFFFSCITPSASGGQPAQILFMKKDKIPIHVSTLVLLIVTITYKLVLVLFGIAVLIVRPTKIMACLYPVMPWMYLGIVLNIVVVGAMLMLVFHPTMAKRGVMLIFRLVKKITKSEKISRYEDRLEHSMQGYHDAACYFKTHRGVMINVLGITIVQRCLLFFITYLVLLSLGMNNVDMIEVLVLQSMISVAVDMLPLPGGMGISEHLFKEIFLPVCGAYLTIPAMIVSRGIGYYTQLFISAIFTVVAYFMIFKRKEE